MSSSFLVVEDVNSVLYKNQEFYWVEIDTSKISEDEDFTDVKYDFCTISREWDNISQFVYTIRVDNSMFTLGYYRVKNILNNITYSNSVITVRCTNPYIVLDLYMGPIKLDSFTEIDSTLRDGDSISLNLKELGTPQRVGMKRRNGNIIYFDGQLERGYNWISSGGHIAGYLLVNFIKTDFQFNPTQTLKIGQNNKVLLGTDPDYKPNGDLIGEYTPSISIEYNNEIIPVEWSSTDNDYIFNLDLTSILEPAQIRFKVNIKSNEVINQTSTIITLNSDYETINSLNDLKGFINTGGIGRLGANININEDILVSEDIKLIGDNHQLFLDNHQFIINEDTVFKAETTIFKYGENTIHQKTGSTVELTDCTFEYCKGLGSVIECDINLESLTNPNDFNTRIRDCTFTDNYMPILHGGELSVSGCHIEGTFDILNDDYTVEYPNFLYQTDGNAILERNNFNLPTVPLLEGELKYYPCIFICGETATINGYNHTELQQNNLTSFLEAPYYNQSRIDLEYYYPPINNLIKLKSDKGYCHAVSGMDTIYKTNVNVTRRG